MDIGLFLICAIVVRNVAELMAVAFKLWGYRKRGIKLTMSNKFLLILGSTIVVLLTTYLVIHLINYRSSMQK